MLLSLLLAYIKLILRNPTVGPSIGEPYTLIYTSRIAYVSYAQVYYLLTPLTLIINCVTSYRLLKYIRLATTIPRPIILYYTFSSSPQLSIFTRQQSISFSLEAFIRAVIIVVDSSRQQQIVVLIDYIIQLIVVNIEIESFIQLFSKKKNR